MTPPLISAVIPSYNHRGFIGEAIASVRSQTYQPVEIVVIDDGSTDGSFEYIEREFGGSLAHLSRRGNRGAHATINDAIAQARGEWIAILNSDDVYAPERIARLFEFTARNNHDLVFSDVSFCDERGPFGHAHKAVQSHARATAAAERGSIEQALLRGNFALTTSNLMMRKATFNAIGPFRPFRYCHDWDFLLRAIGSARIGWLRQPLLNYRLHAANTIREPDQWRHITERGLVYAAFLGGAPGAATDAMSHSGYVLESREFAPIVVSWLLSECRRIGLAAIFRELELGQLHQRLREAFEPHFAVQNAGLAVRDIEKNLNMGLLKNTLARLRNLTRAG
jgi:glycosyltransferase involved in cell wall biosynthesis